MLRIWYDNLAFYRKRYTMDIIIQSLGFTASNALQARVRERLEKLHSSDGIVRANVTLFQGPDKAVQNEYCEIRLEVPGPDIFAKRSNPDFEHAIDETVDALQTQLRKVHEKQREHRGAQPDMQELI